jgi:DNA mismatch repair protein MutS
MAQIGSFVPATEARLGLADRIFTRVGAQDDLAAGQSTFMVEMLETASILHQATSRSLIILDEIGRGTGTLDGLAIARAVVEDIHDRIGARCLFATHYHELLGLLDSLPRLRACNVTVREDDDGIVFLHRIAPGGAARSYGIHVARLAGLPRQVTARAALLLHDMESQAAPLRRVSEETGEYCAGGPSAAPHRHSSNGHAPLAAPLTPIADDAAPLLAEIAALDLVDTTPLAALNLLFSIQQRLRDRARAAPTTEHGEERQL